MQEYDIALKLLLQGSASLAIRKVTGVAVAKWIDVELPKVQNLRVDLLAETARGELVQVELQSSNDPAMPLRMAEYAIGIYRLLNRFPRQVVLYVGQSPLRMAATLRSPDLRFRYRVIDIRDLDGERLLRSPAVGDNVIAILARLRDHKIAIRRIVGRIAVLPPAERDKALGQLLIFAGLRRLSKVVVEEARKMPIDADIRKHEVIGPWIRDARQEGVQEGLREGLQEGHRTGRQEGERTIVQRMIEKRFGPLPAWAKRKLASLPSSTLEALTDRILDAPSLKELMR